MLFLTTFATKSQYFQLISKDRHRFVLSIKKNSYFSMANRETLSDTELNTHYSMQTELFIIPLLFKHYIKSG
jgi:hypothetical protein